MPMNIVRRIYQDGVVEYGFPGHGKGPWDGLGAMAKTKVTRDLTAMVKHLLAVLHAHSRSLSTCAQLFPHCSGSKQHMNTKINEFVVMYLDVVAK